MKKQLLPLILLSVCAFAVNAQVTMSNTPPPFGMEYTLRTSSSAIADASSGADQVWDYSSLSTNAIIGYTVVNPSTLPAEIKDTFPTADFAYKMSAPSDLLAAYEFYDNATTHYVRLGAKSSGSSLNNMRKIDTMMQFGQVYQSTVNYRNMDHVYDGYGTLKVGNKTYTNVVKRKSYTPGSSDTLVQFFQFTPFYHLIFSYAKMSGNVQNVVFFEINTIPTSVKEVKSDLIQMYPNPAKNQLLIKMPEAGAEIYVTDIQGKIVLQRNADTAVLQLDTENWNTGIYFVNVKSKQYSSTQKLIVNK